MPVYITEFRQLGLGGNIQAPEMPPVTEQTRAIGASSAQSSAFSLDTKFIRVHADSICSIAIGANPTATAAKLRMVAGQTEYFAVQGGHKLATIENT